VVNIRLPLLSERTADIILLAMSFLERFSAEMKRKTPAFTQDALYALQSHTWPGNVRELEHRVKRAVILSNGRNIRAGDLELEADDRDPLTLREARRESDRQILVGALRKSCGNISRAARILEISRPSLHELVRKLKIDASEFKSGSRSQKTSHKQEG